MTPWPSDPDYYRPTRLNDDWDELDGPDYYFPDDEDDMPCWGFGEPCDLDTCSECRPATTPDLKPPRISPITIVLIAAIVIVFAVLNFCIAVR